MLSCRLRLKFHCDLEQMKRQTGITQQKLRALSIPLFLRNGVENMKPERSSAAPQVPRWFADNYRLSAHNGNRELRAGS
jgi:hypothetical protein